MEVKLNGIKHVGVSDYIELPSLLELMRNPILHRASAEDVYKWGGELNKYLLDRTPLTHKFKYVNIHVSLKYITPLTSPNKTYEWHVDGATDCVWESGDVSHILIGDSSNMYTEFLSDDVVLDVPSRLPNYEFMKHIDPLLNSCPTTKIGANKIYTFDSLAPHRAPIDTKRNEFRFFWRVLESDYQHPLPYNEALLDKVNVLRKSDGIFVPSLEQYDKWIIIRDKPEIL